MAGTPENLRPWLQISEYNRHDKYILHKSDYQGKNGPFLMGFYLLNQGGRLVEWWRLYQLRKNNDRDLFV
jgi:hypothetical protein